MNSGTDVQMNCTDELPSIFKSFHFSPSFDCPQVYLGEDWKEMSHVLKSVFSQSKEFHEWSNWAISYSFIVQLASAVLGKLHQESRLYTGCAEDAHCGFMPVSDCTDPDGCMLHMWAPSGERLPIEQTALCPGHSQIPAESARVLPRYCPPAQGHRPGDVCCHASLVPCKLCLLPPNNWPFKLLASNLC